VTTDETAFWAALQKNPKDDATRLVSPTGSTGDPRGSGTMSLRERPGLAPL
jgi:hypothetical protein